MWVPSLPNLFTQPLGCHCTMLHFRSTCGKRCFLPSAQHSPSSPSDPQKSVGIYLCLCEAPGWISGNAPSTGSPSSLCINCQLTHACWPGGAIRGPLKDTQAPCSPPGAPQGAAPGVPCGMGPRHQPYWGTRTEGHQSAGHGGLFGLHHLWWHLFIFFQEKLDRQFAARPEDNCLLCRELWGGCCRGYVKCPGLAPCSQPGGVSAEGTHLRVEPRKPRMLQRVHLMKLTPKRLVTC